MTCSLIDLSFGNIAPLAWRFDAGGACLHGHVEMSPVDPVGGAVLSDRVDHRAQLVLIRYRGGRVGAGGRRVVVLSIHPAAKLGPYFAACNSASAGKPISSLPVAARAPSLWLFDNVLTPFTIRI